jgi:hypothetical protein
MLGAKFSGQMPPSCVDAGFMYTHGGPGYCHAQPAPQRGPPTVEVAHHARSPARRLLVAVGEAYSWLVLTIAGAVSQVARGALSGPEIEWGVVSGEGTRASAILLNGMSARGFVADFRAIDQTFGWRLRHLRDRLRRGRAE